MIAFGIAGVGFFEWLLIPKTAQDAHGCLECEGGCACMGQKGQASLWGTINSLCALCTAVLELFQQLGCSCLQDGVINNLLL